jgi:peptidoglycan/xylan/chitin deacetylase (PgdA/CDA1 family)
MITITEKMTPVLFIAAINSNFKGLRSVTTLLTATEDNYISVINSNNAAINAITPFTYTILSAGDGIGLIANINNNFSALEQKYMFDKGKVIFTFDDAWESWYTVGFPLFKGLGIIASLCITTGNVGTAGYLSWAEILEMYNAGIDIIDHSATHPDMRTLTALQIQAELQSSTDAFLANGLPSPTDFVIPSGFTNSFVNGEIAKYRRSSRGAIGAYCADFKPIFKNQSKYVIQAPVFDSISSIGNGQLGYMKGAIDFCNTHKTALMFYGHKIGTTYAALTTMLSDLNTIVGYARASGVDIISYKQLVDLMV